MRTCVPFLLPALEQVDPAWTEQGLGLEATLFDRADLLDAGTWQRCIDAVAHVASEIRPASFVLHFPVNDCSYVDDPAVASRLDEAVDLVLRFGLDGFVVHANRIRPANAWTPRLVGHHREQVVEALAPRAARLASHGAWLGLENMPIMGNEPDESDPTFVFPADFDCLAGTDIGVTWDLCHWTYSLTAIQELKPGGILASEHELYPNVRDARSNDWMRLGDRIVHFHFSAFNGIASERHGTSCVEGAVPWDSQLGEDAYHEHAAWMFASGVKTVTLEVREDDYRRRHNLLRTAAWLDARRLEVSPADRGRSRSLT